MDIPTVPGTWYTVASSTTCEITDTATGTPLGTADAGSYSFQAQGTLTTLSDDSALYSKSNFKSAPAALMALGRLGGGSSTSSLPAGYIAAEFLEGNGTQWVNSKILINNQFEFEISMDWKNTFTYSYNAIFGTISNGFFIYAGNNGSMRLIAGSKDWQALNLEYPGGRLFVELKGNTIKFNENSAVIERGTATSRSEAYLWAMKGVANYVSSFKLYFCNIKNEAEERAFIPALDDKGKACLFDKVTNQPIYNSGTGQFIVGMNMKQALKLSKLPATGGTLTISLPEGYDADPAVTAAIATATANGWNITIQTYTPEAAAASSSFALRRIWVRQTPSEFGPYVDESGNRFTVEWCVAMSHTDGSEPDAHGYELFRSVDAAVDFWQLTPYVDPEAESLTDNP